MPENENPPLDYQDWNIAFRAYEEFPILAFILAQHLDSVKVLIQHSAEGQELALAGLDRAIESLMPHTIFRDAGRKLYLSAVTGNLLPQDEEAIRALGFL